MVILSPSSISRKRILSVDFVWQDEHGSAGEPSSRLSSMHHQSSAVPWPSAFDHQPMHAEFDLVNVSLMDFSPAKQEHLMISYSRINNALTVSRAGFCDAANTTDDGNNNKDD
jgi:hypothetical protein